MSLNYEEIGKVCERIRKQRILNMLDKIKKLLAEAADAEINLHSEVARALLARQIVLELYGEVELNG
jgi:hypothetical protein